MSHSQPPLEAADLLAHLTPCSHCDHGRLSMPLLCSGKKDPNHTDCWYQVCVVLLPDTDDTCPAFTWRRDIPKGRRPPGSLVGDRRTCPGMNCRNLTQAHRINQDCSFGLCSQCCQHAHAVLRLRACRVYTHNRAPTATTRRRGVQLIQQTAAPQAASASVDALSPAAVVPAREHPPSTAPLFATSISSRYAQRVDAMDIEERRRAERQVRAEQAAADEAKRVVVYWHEKDGAPARLVPVDIAPNRWPMFHPKDSPHLVAKYKVDTIDWQSFDWKLNRWVDGSSETGARSVLTAGELHYRPDGVTDGPDMPDCEPSPAPPITPSRRILGTSSPWTTPQAAHSWPSSSALWTPRLPSPSSAQPSTPITRSSSSLSPSAASSRAPTPSSSATVSSRATGELGDIACGDLGGSESPSDVRPPEPPLPSLLSTMAASAIIAPPPDGAAPPTGRSGWPLRYVVDMAAGFAKMEQLQRDGLKTEDAFQSAFGRPPVRQTFYQNRAAWRAALQHPDDVAAWVKHGRTAEGEWCHLYAKYKTR
ncbi:hypothetical protein C8Q76DRAFT_689393 [Earliella scabrosa]|nr:hypothetical protein C8Q76DRAFT_689393 [Earliella scabrosa]